MSERETRARAEAVRDACVEAALRAWEDGGLSGLCAEGRWELAVDAIRRLDVSDVAVPAADRSRRQPSIGPADGTPIDPGARHTNHP